MLNVHQHVVCLVFNIIESFQFGLIALIIGFSCQVYPHGLKIHCCGCKLCFRPKVVGADGQSVRVNKIGVQIHQYISIYQVKWKIHGPERECGIFEVDAAHVVAVAAHVGQHMGAQ